MRKAYKEIYHHKGGDQLSYFVDESISIKKRKVSSHSLALLLSTQQVSFQFPTFHFLFKNNASGEKKLTLMLSIYIPTKHFAIHNPSINVSEIHNICPP